MPARRALPPMAVVLLASLACRPVIAIGWGEFIVLVIVIALLLWPLFARLYRTFSRLRQIERDESERKK